MKRARHTRPLKRAIIVRFWRVGFEPGDANNACPEGGYTKGVRWRDWTHRKEVAYILSPIKDRSREPDRRDQQGLPGKEGNSERIYDAPYRAAALGADAAPERRRGTGDVANGPDQHVEAGEMSGLEGPGIRSDVARVLLRACH